MGPPLFAFLQDERAIFPKWKELVARYDVKGKPAHDARLVAAMLRHGLSHLLTFNDADYKRFPAITVIPPGALISGNAVI
jgi:predicted nucleic acid-binding protein